MIREMMLKTKNTVRIEEYSVRKRLIYNLYEERDG